MELRFNARTDVIQAFATPIYGLRIFEAEPLNADLKSLILNDESSDPGVQRSNVGGWHSREDFLSRPERAVRTFKELALTAVRTVMPLMVGGACRFDVKVAGWANVLRRGGQNRRHVHPGNHLSIVYYVDAGTPAAASDASVGGALELIDPRAHVEMTTLAEDPLGRGLIVQPYNGQMVIFPSWMYHQVNPYQGDAERISIAVNAHISNVMRLPETRSGELVNARH
ncbi:hypothetical protein BAL199_04819 [alpha proteobacterium BAL199]|jgi:uncharacterized protein (TIGR02466 family)|nr:hypothetical protein BAL199_04819 [alpha proteobacterium BAL199]